MLRNLFKGAPISRLSFDAPTPRAGREGVVLVLMVRDEERHIGEWARFHKQAGVSRVVVYDNGSIDKTLDEMTSVLGDMLTVVPWDQRLFDQISGRELHNHVLASAHAIRNFGPDHRWLSVIDADEFLVPVKNNSLPEALEELEDCKGISLPWHNFGRCGHKEIPEGGVIENYTYRAADPASGARGVSNFKNIVDPCHVTGLRLHSYQIDGTDVTWNDRGEKGSNATRREREFFSAERIQLNHYYSRSDAEFSAKIARGPNRKTDAAKHEARVRRNLANIEAETVEDRSALKFLERIGGL